MFLVVQKLTRILKRIPLIYFVTAGLLLGLTFYTYIPARGLWLIFPALLAYWLFTDRRLLRQLWWRVGLMVIVMLLVAGPLLRYLQANPTAEQRLGQLAQPLTAAQNGDLTPLLTNISGSLRLFFVAGDTAWRYNITGRPFLGPLMGGLFVLGLGTAIWFVVRRKSNGRRQQLGSASFLALAWLIAGLAPVLITGPTLSMTQAIGLQPVLYLFPALGLVTLGQVTIGSKQLRSYEWARWVVALLFLFTAVLTTRDYFGTWANDPEVRVQYETTMISAMNYLNRHKTASAVISTITPGPFHTPALAQMVVQDKELALHWFNARGALLLPAAAESQMLIPGFTPLSPALTDYLATAVLQTSLPMRKTDQDRPLDVYHIDQAAMLADWQRQFTPLDANFDGTLQLLGYDLQTPQVAPGEELRLVTWWQVLRPLPEAKLFTHLLGPDGVPLAQTDRLDVPGYAWQEGDMFVQLHRFFVPEATAVGDYALAVGLYTQNDGQRLPLQNPSQAADLFTVTKVTIRP